MAIAAVLQRLDRAEQRLKLKNTICRSCGRAYKPGNAATKLPQFVLTYSKPGAGCSLSLNAWCFRGVQLQKMTCRQRWPASATSESSHQARSPVLSHLQLPSSRLHGRVSIKAGGKQAPRCTVMAGKAHSCLVAPLQPPARCI